MEVVSISSLPGVLNTVRKKGSPRSIPIEPITFKGSPGIRPVVGVKHGYLKVGSPFILLDELLPKKLGKATAKKDVLLILKAEFTTVVEDRDI